MSPPLSPIRDFVMNEIKSSKQCDVWFWDEHVAVVEKLAKKLLESHPDANEEITLLSVWFHDLGRAYGHDEGHDIWGADFAKKHLSEKGFDQHIVEGVYHACLAHRVKTVQPESVEARILATADALSHFEQGFYLRIFYAWSNKMSDYPLMKQRLLKKMERDFEQKIFFPEVKEKVRPLYESWQTALSSLALTPSA